MTPLEKLQKRIDQCNHKNGCDSCCPKEVQEKCNYLQAHAKRIAECRKMNLPIHLW